MKGFPLALAAAMVSAAAMIPATATAHDQSTTPVVAPGHTLLSLSADGRTTRTPDLAAFNAGVTSQGKTAGEALAANSTEMNKVVAALKRAGIADRDIQTSNLSLNPIYAPQRTLPNGEIVPPQPTIIGYQVHNTVNVRQRDLANYGRVIDTLVAAGANQVNGPSFEMDNPDAALDEARAQAMGKARDRANLYAKAAGLKVVRILSISESGGYAPHPPIIYARAAMADMAPPPPPPPVAPGELQMTANVSVLFELAP